LAEIFFILNNNKNFKIGKFKRRLVISAKSLKSPINLKSVSLNKHGVNILLNEIEKTLQSNDSLILDDSIELFVCSCKVAK